MPLLEEFIEKDSETTYFAFRVPTKVHHKMKAVLARRGITGQAFFLHVVEKLLAEEREQNTLDLLQEGI